MPTILEATGIPAPAMVNGIAQKPIEGVSMVYTFDKANANAPSTRTTQYFEMFGNRAIYHDGWIARTTPPAAPWLMGLAKMPDVVNGYKWELYNIAEDYSQYNDLAAKMPDKLRDMQELFLVEAAKYNVFPLDNVVLQRALAPRPSATAGRTVFTYSGEMSGMPQRQRPEHPRQVVHHYRRGGNPAGWRRGDARHRRWPLRRLRPLPAQGQAGLYLYNSRPGALPLGRPGRRSRPASTRSCSTSNTTVPASARAAPASCRWTARKSPRKTIPHTIPFLMTFDETFDIGVDTRTPWTTTTTRCRSGSPARSTS